MYSRHFFCLCQILSIRFLFGSIFFKNPSYSHYASVEPNFCCLKSLLYLWVNCPAFTSTEEDWYYIAVQPLLPGSSVIFFALQSFCKSYFVHPNLLRISVSHFSSSVKIFKFPYSQNDIYFYMSIWSSVEWIYIVRSSREYFHRFCTWS